MKLWGKDCSVCACCRYYIFDYFSTPTRKSNKSILRRKMDRKIECNGNWNHLPTWVIVAPVIVVLAMLFIKPKKQKE